MSDPDLPSVAVVGPGAIGTTATAALHQRGAVPLLVGRTPRPGLQLDTDDASVVVPGPVRTDPTAVGSRVDVVFLAVKATQTADAAPWLGLTAAVPSGGREHHGLWRPSFRPRVSARTTRAGDGGGTVW